MRKTISRAAVLWILIAAFLGAVVFLGVQFALHGAQWATNKANRHIYSNGTVVNAGTIYDRNGKALAESKEGKRVFPQIKEIRMACLHVVGDTSGVISTGTHNLYRSALSGYNPADGIYSLKKTGTGPDITLNIDCEANRIAYSALGDFKGAIVVCNYKTGELLCSVSKPAYDVNNVPSDLRTNKKYDGVFLDKAASGIYTPGSIMKIVTAACAIENIPDIYDRTFECAGEYEAGDGKVICNGVHGKINFAEAMNKSCNCAFAEISVELGASKLLATAESLGFNKQLSAKEVPLVKSRFNPSTKNKFELGWAGIGQSTTYVNPMHFLGIMNAIANGGTGYAPDRIKSMGAFGEIVGRFPETMVQINPETASELKKLLRSNVTDEYGEGKFPNLKMCGKTGTAQIDGEKSHSVFAGFSSREDLPLAVVCIAENAGWGSGVAANTANKVLQYFLDNYT